MKIQLACDFYHLYDALQLLELIGDEIDIIEVGTDLMFAEGAKAIKVIKDLYPQKVVLSDLKVMDGGKELGAMVYDYGADIFTVLGVAPEETVQAACAVAKQYHKKVCVDMINVTDNIERAKKFINWGADYLCVHTADDQKEHVTFYHHLKDYSESIGAQHCSIAGGLNPESIRSIRQYEPEIIVVGGYVTQAKDPVKAVREIKEAMYG